MEKVKRNKIRVRKSWEPEREGEKRGGVEERRHTYVVAVLRRERRGKRERDVWNRRECGRGERGRRDRGKRKREGRETRKARRREKERGKRD